MSSENRNIQNLQYIQIQNFRKENVNIGVNISMLILLCFALYLYMNWN